jgi:hypothetical protein
VVKNNTLGQIKWEQMVFLGNPEYGVNFALDESTFDASPGHIIPDKVGQAAAGVVGRLRDHASDEHPE